VLVQRKAKVGEAVKKNGEQKTAKWKRERDRDRNCVKRKNKEQSDRQGGNKDCAECSQSTTSIAIA
jgi:hypothetical protein